MFWAKWENLDKLKTLLQKLFLDTQKEYLKNTEISIPMYIKIDDSKYKSYLKLTKNSENIEQDLEDLFAEEIVWLSERIDKKFIRYIVRSSAIKSEDWEITWAWIYESIDARSEKDLIKTIIKVYESMNTPLAKKYRKNHWIKNETMGLILQEYKTWSTPHEIALFSDDNRWGWYINTDIGDWRMKISMNGTSVIINKTILWEYIKNKTLPFFEDYTDAEMFMIDMSNFPSVEQKSVKEKINKLFINQVFDRRSQNLAILERVAIIWYFLEKTMNEPIQIEYWYDGYEESQIFLYQVRKYNQKSTYIGNLSEFSSQDIQSYIQENWYSLVAEWESILTINTFWQAEDLLLLERNMRSSYNSKYQKILEDQYLKWWVIGYAYDSHAWSIKDSNIEDVLAKINILMIASQSRSLDNWHLETRCIEMNIPYIDNIHWFEKIHHSLIHKWTLLMISDGTWKVTIYWKSSD